MEFQRGIKRKRTQVNITPLIDVVFLLVVFFMLTSTFISYEAIELSVESDSGYNPEPSPKDDKPIYIKIFADNHYMIDNRRLDKEALSAYLAPRIRHNKKQQIYLNPVDNTDIQSVVSVMDKIRLLGGKHLSLVEAK